MPIEGMDIALGQAPDWAPDAVARLFILQSIRSVFSASNAP